MSDKKKTRRTPDPCLGRTADRPYWIWMTSIFIRALHQVGAAVFLTVFLLPGRPDLPRMYLVLAGVTGVLLMTTEMLRHRQLLREPAGLATLVKLVLMAMAIHGWLPAAPAMLAAFVLAAFFAHAPKHIRHLRLF
jgi:CHASE2 domain-containing sensor protein